MRSLKSSTSRSLSITTCSVGNQVPYLPCARRTCFGLAVENSGWSLCVGSDVGSSAMRCSSWTSLEAKFCSFASFINCEAFLCDPSWKISWKIYSLMVLGKNNWTLLIAKWIIYSSLDDMNSLKETSLLTTSLQHTGSQSRYTLTSRW